MKEAKLTMNKINSDRVAGLLTDSQAARFIRETEQRYMVYARKLRREEANATELNGLLSQAIQTLTEKLPEL